MREHARATLLTLTPTLPSRPDPCGPTCRPDCLSWGCPKIAPPSFRIEESAARAARRRASLRRRTASPSRVPSAWFRTTSTVSSSPTVQVCFALLPILGFALFHPVTKRESSRRAFCPSKLSLRRQRRIRALFPACPSARACVTGATIAGRSLHRMPCPLTLHSVHREDDCSSHVRRGCPLRLPGAGASRPCSIVGSVARVPVASHESPVLPWAWPIPPVASLPVAPRRTSRRRSPG